MPEADLESICESVRRCIEELSTFLGKLEDGLGAEREAGREAYERLIGQLRARQSDLENQIRLPEPHCLMSDAQVRNVEAAWRQLEHSAQCACRELGGLLTDSRNSLERSYKSTPQTNE